MDDKKIESYGKDKEDLGNITDYSKFLDELKIVFGQVYDALKFKSRCAIIVMDIRKKNKFYPLHMDISLLMKEIGFELEEFVIWDRQHEYNNMTTLGYPYVYRFNRIHEFICIFNKPGQ